MRCLCDRWLQTAVNRFSPQNRPAILTESSMAHKLRHWSPFVFGAVFLFALFFRLGLAPALWWDEGWTASVARNWVELGHYGRLSLGEKALPGLEATFPVTGSVALAFKYIGIGLFQARLVIAIYLVAALILLFYLARRFYGRRVAVGALFVLLLMPGNGYMHLLFMGRRIFAEVPSLFFLLAGYVCFLWAGERHRLFLLGSILFWSLAIITKAQVLPFWAVSLGVTFAVAIFYRRWTLAGMFAAGLLGSVSLGYAWLALISRFLIPTSSSVSGLYLTIGLVLDPFRRFITVLTILQVGLPTLLSLVWALRDQKTGKELETTTRAVMIAYFILAGSWFGWWALASTGWTRYLFPSAFLASIFVSAMFHEWTNGFRIREMLWNTATNLIHRQTSWSDLRMLATLFLVVWSFVHTVTDLNDGLFRKTNTSLFQTVEYLNTSTPSTAVIETYESELFFFLHRRYHYPPDQVHVELIRREDLSESRVINYDPLSADPDYLVVGIWCRYYKCYDSVLNDRIFKLVKVFGPYQIFERVREPGRSRDGPAQGTTSSARRKDAVDM